MAGKRTAENEGLPKYVRRRSYGVIYSPYKGRVNGRILWGKDVNLCPADASSEEVWAIFKRKILKAKPKTLDLKQSRAHVRVNQAIARGLLVRQPCEVCGASNEVDAHHDDYDQPLAVRWLCKLHHAQWHSENGPGANLTEYRPVRRRFRCKSECYRCTSFTGEGADWCAAMKDEPTGICESFNHNRNLKPYGYNDTPPTGEGE